MKGVYEATVKIVIEDELDNKDTMETKEYLDDQLKAIISKNLGDSKHSVIVVESDLSIQ